MAKHGGYFRGLSEICKTGSAALGVGIRRPSNWFRSSSTVPLEGIRPAEGLAALVPTDVTRPAPTPSVQICWQSAHFSPRRHAQALLEWLWSNGYGSAELLSGNMQRTYAGVCRELNWAVRPWNPVARELTRLTTKRKLYRWIVRDGIRHRLHVYLVPTPNTASVNAIAQVAPDDQTHRHKASSQPTPSFTNDVQVARPVFARRRADGRRI